MPQSKHAAFPRNQIAHEERDWHRARAIVMHYGSNSMAYQILNPGMQWWFSASTDAVIGYRLAAGYVVVAGEPVCHPLQQVDVAREFATAMAPHTICYFGSEPAFAHNLQAVLPCDVMWLGMQPWWQPAVWRQRVWAKQSLRALFSYARRRGVQVRAMPRREANQHPQLQSCLHQWLNHKRLPPLHFVLESNTLAHLHDRQIFVAELHERIIAFVVLSPLPLRNGWVVEQFVRMPDAVKGTMELLLDSAVAALAQQQSAVVTLGLAPLSAHTTTIHPSQRRHVNVAMLLVRYLGESLYHFAGLDTFKAKFQPQTWQPIYAVVPQQRISLRTLYAITAAFCQVSPLVFAVHILAHVWTRWWMSRMPTS